MDRTAVHALVDRLVDVEAAGVAGLDREAAGAVLGAIARLRSWAEYLRLGVVARVAELSPTPEREIADADGSSARGIARDITTAQTLGGGHVGGTAESLATGATTRGHIDVLADAFRSLDSTALRQRFRDQLPDLDAMARQTPVDAFARHVRKQLAAAGRAGGPDTPSDPLARQRWLLAQALVHLAQGTAAPARRPEISVIVMDGARVVEAPGVLDRRRATRLASADQRRVLRSDPPRRSAA